MFAYGQTAANAIAVMSYLAAEPSRRAGSGEIAKARGLSRALTAKLLTQLAAAEFLTGQPGPGGGYTLAKCPSEISLLDIASVFEQTDPPSVCPVGRGWCGHGEPCPLHDSIHGLLEINRRFMEETCLSIFQAPAFAHCRTHSHSGPGNQDVTGSSTAKPSQTIESQTSRIA